MELPFAVSSRSVPIETSADVLPQGMLERINALAASRLSAEDVYVRSMYLCSDQVCEADWLCFTPAALEQVAQRVVGRSVLAGHDRRTLPLARFCHATVTERTDAPGRWVRAWFYWLRDTAGAHDLLRNIDGGIYREVSISWRYCNDTCSVCGAQRHGCNHVPGRCYDGKHCYRLIHEVVDVLEGSLVYRAADEAACVTGVHGKGEAASRASGIPWPDAAAAAALARLFETLPASVRQAALFGPIPPALAVTLLELGLAVRWCDPPPLEVAGLGGLPTFAQGEPIEAGDGGPMLVLVERRWADEGGGERLVAGLSQGTTVVVVAGADEGTLAALGVRAQCGSWPSTSAQVRLGGACVTLAMGKRA